MELASLGWNKRFADAFSTLTEPGLCAGRIVNEDRHSCRVVGVAGEIGASVAGRLRHHAASSAALPKIGDWVAYAPLPGEAKGVIQHVLPRTTQLVRKIAGRETSEQVLAANVDVAFVVQALDQTFKARRLERFMVMAHEGGIRPVVVLNKADLCADAAALVADAQAAAGDALVIVTSAKSRRGLKQLVGLIQPGQTVVFIGTSGVGKSTLINRLYGEAVQATIEVRKEDSKGRHTTSSRELLPLPGGGLVIDTPGVREFQLLSAEDGLDEAFPDVTTLAAGCRFRDCQHDREADCAVRAAQTAGSLSPSRYQSFLKLQAELGVATAQRAERSRVLQRRQSRQRPRPDDDPDQDA